MRRLQRPRKPDPQGQLSVKVTSAQTETHTPNDRKRLVWKKKVAAKTRSLAAGAAPRSVQVSCRQTQKSGFSSEKVLNTGEHSPKESINKTLRVEEYSAAVKGSRRALHPDSAIRGGTTRVFPADEPLEVKGEEEQTEEEDIKAPVALIMGFLRAVTDRDCQLACKLCQMILVYEPDNPEASEFLPLIHKKLLEEQEAEWSSQDEEEDDEDDESDDSESDEVASQTSRGSSSSCSSSQPSDDDEEEEKRVNRHKPCPPSDV